jgi:cytochrome P450
LSPSLDLSLHQAGALPPPPRAALAHIPGDEGWPLVGNTFKVLADPKRFTERMAQRYGPVHRSRVFGETGLALLGPEANELVLFDAQKLFSSALGWGPILDLLFPRGLMLLDFEEHRLHRRVLSVAFKAGPMNSYLQRLNHGISTEVAKWPRKREIPLNPLIKALTLELATNSFLGSELGPELEPVKRAFTAMVAASISVIRVPLPATKMRRGVKSRAFVIEYLTRLIPYRREKGGDDLFSQLCCASYEDGSLLTAQDIVDHFSFLMMAAHDTLTSALSSLLYWLAAHPEWQEKVRAELASLRLAPGEPLGFTDLDKLVLGEMVFKEAMRLIPPVPSIPRRAVRAFEFKGFRIPAGTSINVNPLYTHHMAEVWPQPERFDPLRFTEEVSRDRHKFAFIPFGGGAHTCIGLNFAYMQAKCFLFHCLRDVRVTIAPGYRPDWQMWPIPRPRDGLMATLSPLQ